MNVVVIGTGMYPFGFHQDIPMEMMSYQSLKTAFNESRILPSDIDAAYFSNVLASRLFAKETLGQHLLELYGINGIPIINVENACASGSTAVHEGIMAIKSGQCEVVVVLGVEKITGSGLGMITTSEEDLETRLGFSMPSHFALKANRYLHEHNLDAKDLAQVSVKNYRHAYYNEAAVFKKTNLSIEDVLHSPMISDPLTRLQCCAMPDGAACIILASEKWAKKRNLTFKPVTVLASVLISGEYKNPPNLSFWESDERAATKAYQAAGLEPKDIDLVEAHDAFTISEVMHYEGLGFCERGEGIGLLVNNETAIGGRIPFNPSGGLLGRGHALGATGIAQTIEIVHQLQNRATNRQVEHARIGMTHCMGGDKAGDARATAVQIYQI